jgi:hypothetical protein
MTNNSFVRYAAAAALLLMAWPTNAGAQEEMKLKFGTWKLNVQKSQFPAGTEPQSDTRVYEDRGGGVIMSTHTTINHQGKESLTIYAAKFDRKEYPVVTRGSAALSTIAFDPIDRYSESFVLTREGKVAVRGTTSISKDGRTLTMTMDTTNPNGQTGHIVDIYEKQ